MSADDESDGDGDADLEERRPPLEDLRRTPLGSIDPLRAAWLSRDDEPDATDPGRIDSAQFGSAI
ncbi:FXSXX-COOH protein [Actinoplanes sp. L3-i22]|uniref:FXSXX-COOH protein n=1 Tax=Actinoplanes sp. L3-i22 TaxID=2836373 RepID=UPI001C77CB62|nr:FXSXX-COOH protein [Actinoplanes sp. L3-i22]BCY10099.1 hypothetical protein L3i22_051870 [Actinoplanes sp. L3-i22]